MNPAVCTTVARLRPGYGSQTCAWAGASGIQSRTWADGLPIAMQAGQCSTQPAYSASVQQSSGGSAGPGPAAFRGRQTRVRPRPATFGPDQIRRTGNVQA